MKLLGFTLAMIVVPIGSYFATLNTIYKGKEGPKPVAPEGIYRLYSSSWRLLVLFY